MKEDVLRKECSDPPASLLLVQLGAGEHLEGYACQTDLWVPAYMSFSLTLFLLSSGFIADKTEF